MWEAGFMGLLEFRAESYLLSTPFSYFIVKVIPTQGSQCICEIRLMPKIILFQWLRCPHSLLKRDDFLF